MAVVPLCFGYIPFAINLCSENIFKLTSLNIIFQAHTPIFCAGVLASLTIELKGSKDFSKLYAGLAILGYIASVLDPINSQAFSHLLTFLGHRYPKVCRVKSFY